MRAVMMRGRMVEVSSHRANKFVNLSGRFVIPDGFDACQLRAARRACPSRLAGREVADARVDLKGSARHFDLDAAEAAVARGVGGRVIERVLAAQFFGDFAVDAVERGEALRLVEATAGGRRQLREVALARVEDAHALSEVADAQLVEADGGVRPGEQVVEFRLLARALDLGVADDVDGDLREGVRVLDASERNLSQLTSATGGRLYKPQSFATLDRVYGEIAEELRSQYALYYTPTDSARDGRFRRVKVEVPGRDLQVNTRIGYFAPR